MEKFGEWKHKFCVSDLNRGGSVSWTIQIKEPGTYNINVQTRGEGRKVWRVETDENRAIQNQQRSSSIFTEAPIGWINFDKPGKHNITIRLVEGGNVDLAGISITPIKFN